jgi:hypothetical protein
MSSESMTYGRRPSKFELVINLRTTKVLGLAMLKTFKWPPTR